MKQISDYIYEKLHIDKDTKLIYSYDNIVRWIYEIDGIVYPEEILGHNIYVRLADSNFKIDYLYVSNKKLCYSCKNGAFNKEIDAGEILDIFTKSELQKLGDCLVKKSYEKH